MLAIIGLFFIVLGLLAFGYFLYSGLHYYKRNSDLKNIVAGCCMAGLSLGFCAGIGAGIMIGYPEYLVWQQEKEGEAALAKASQDRQIKVQEAEAEREAAIAQAEANKTLGESIRAYPEAMEQKWVEAIKETDNQVIYLPTECSIPVTEAGRVAKKLQPQE